MYDESLDTPAPPKRNRRALTIGLVGAGLAAGAIGATALGANATSTSTTAPVASTAPSVPAGAPRGAHDGPRGGSAPVRDDEKALSASTAATLKAAALKAVPGGTVYRLETDAGDGVYEAHMTKADGTAVTVKFGKDLKVTKVETGMGTGDPARAGGPGDGH